jgi:hypothetical protein
VTRASRQQAPCRQFTFKPGVRGHSAVIELRASKRAPGPSRSVG